MSVLVIFFMLILSGKHCTFYIPTELCETHGIFFPPHVISGDILPIHFQAIINPINSVNVTFLPTSYLSRLKNTLSEFSLLSHAKPSKSAQKTIGHPMSALCF